MSKTAYARRQHEERTERQELRLVEPHIGRPSRTGDTLEVVGLAVVVLAAWFMAALIFVPSLSGLFG